MNDGSISSCAQLDAEDRLAFQRRSWRWQARGRALVVVFLGAAVIGLFGGGPLSRHLVTAHDNTLRVEYPRLVRAQSSHRLVVDASAPAVNGDVIEIWISTRLLDSIQLESVTPEPTATRLDEGRTIFQFSATATSDPAPVVFHVKTDNPGRHTGGIGLVNGPELTLVQWCFP